MPTFKYFKQSARVIYVIVTQAEVRVCVCLFSYLEFSPNNPKMFGKLWCFFFLSISSIFGQNISSTLLDEEDSETSTKPVLFCFSFGLFLFLI